MIMNIELSGINNKSNKRISTYNDGLYLCAYCDVNPIIYADPSELSKGN